MMNDLKRFSPIVIRAMRCVEAVFETFACCIACLALKQSARNFTVWHQNTVKRLGIPEPALPSTLGTASTSDACLHLQVVHELALLGAKACACTDLVHSIRYNGCQGDFSCNHKARERHRFCAYTFCSTVGQLEGLRCVQRLPVCLRADRVRQDAYHAGSDW